MKNYAKFRQRMLKVETYSNYSKVFKKAKMLRKCIKSLQSMLKKKNDA